MSVENHSEPQNNNEEVYDLEHCSKHGLHIPKGARLFRIRIDKENYVVNVLEMTGKELLKLAGKTPVEEYGLYQKIHGGKRVRIGLDETVDFTSPGIEKFNTLPLDQNEGKGGTEVCRRQFCLPESDVEYLDSLDLKWESVVEGNVKRVVIYDYPIIDGYNVSKVNLYIKIDGGYSDTQIDMVYFFPHLERTSGAPIKAIAKEHFDGKSWQRWSRHRSKKNPWRPGVDDISTHMGLVDEWLKSELKKG